MGDWEPADGTMREDEVIALQSCAVVTATRMCCPEHGVTHVVLLEFVGDIMGITIGGKLELSLETAGHVSQALQEAVERW